MKKVALLALSVLCALSAVAADFPAVGTAAPDFSLENDQGKQTSLKDFRGKWVVLYFYPKDFTGGCTIQAQNFQRDLASYEAKNAAVVGVSVDSVESHQQFCSKEGLKFRLLSDPEAKVSAAYHSVMEYKGAKLSARNTFLIDPQGRVARVFAGVKPAGHSDEVLAALDELQKNTRASRVVTCESEDGKRRICRTDTTGGVAVARQLSRSACVEGRTWGFSNDGIWVDEGCRAEFAVRSPHERRVTITTTVPAPNGAELTPAQPAPAAATISAVPTPAMMLCESRDGRRKHCAADTSMGVRLYRQMSGSNCVLNSSWGFDAKGVWVNDGCRAEFALGEGHGVTRNIPQASRVLCESKDGKRTVCPADTSMGVAVVRRVSDSPCVLNSTWGYNTDGIWVTAGCRAEFVLRK